jgi:opacity protein-like surface antigen
MATLLASTAGFAHAQEMPATGGRVFALVGGVLGEGDTTVLAAAGAGLRVTSRLGLDVEVLYAQDLGLPVDVGFVIQTFAPVERIERSRLVAFLTQMTVELPVAGGRVWPYVTGGGGIGSLRQTVTFRNLPLPVTNLADVLEPSIFPGPEINVTTTDLALTIGGGLDVRLWKGLAVGGHVRYLRLLDAADSFDFALVTSRVSYRF